MPYVKWTTLPKTNMYTKQDGVENAPLLKKHGYFFVYTPRKFNIAPKNRQSQKETHLPTIIFQSLC